MKIHSIFAAAVLVATGIVSPVAPESASAQQVSLTPEQILAEIGPSVPLIQTKYGHGSGVLISPRLVATNAHVVYPFNRADVTFSNGARASDANVVAWDLAADMVLIELPGDAPVPPLEAISEAGLPVGTPVYAVGYPGQPDGTAPLTVLGGSIGDGSRDWPGIGVHYVQTDIPVRPGMSGGAVVTGNGELISFN